METAKPWFETISPDTFHAEKERLWKDPTNIRRWAKEAIDSDSRLYQCYRVLGADIDDDLSNASKCFLPEKGVAPSAESYSSRAYDLKFIWRSLLRRYAFCEALRVGRVLRDLREPWHWRLWRFKDLFLPRLAMGVFAGFLLLSAGSLTVDILQGASKSAMFWWVLGSAAAFVFGLAVSDVQRRVGRRPWTVIAGRGCVISAFGIFYSLVGGLITYYGGCSLGFRPSSKHIVLCSAAALLLGFTFQLFAQERSIGDPL